MYNVSATIYLMNSFHDVHDATEIECFMISLSLSLSLSLILSTRSEGRS